MKIILSRKGFDSGYGGMPSPILPDGTMLSMPIPSNGDRVLYNDLHYERFSYRDIISQLKPNSNIISSECHLDPDIRRDVIARKEGWRPAFGQVGAAQSHLSNQGVDVGDIFLFFGWFRHTAIKNGKLSFVGPLSGFHVIYGYMQVGEIITNPDDVPEWLKSHPHACGDRWQKNNAIYIASDRLSLDPNLPGAGCFEYSEVLRLTKLGCCRSVWSLPTFFKDIEISYNRNAWRKDGFHSAAKGQEFVFEANEDVIKWLKFILVNGINQPSDRKKDTIAIASLRQELIKYCRYYDGKDCNPYEGGEQNASMFYFYESCWVNELAANKGRLSLMLQEYCANMRRLLPDMYNDDIMPFTYKALLLDRYMHFGGNSEGFREFFAKSYKNVETPKAPIFGISRLRMGTDGPGITTLVTFMRCPLRCKYCANPQCHKLIYKDDGNTLNDGVMMLTPQELYDIVKIDNLYFQATGGGVCFGGGEPTLYADFIEEFRRICNANWKITLETSLYCSHGTKRQLSGIVDHWIVDVKSIHSSIYESYTGKMSGILYFLRSLQMLVPQEKVAIKVPRIPNYNDDYDLINDVNEIKHRFGFENVEIVDYKILK